MRRLWMAAGAGLAVVGLAGAAEWPTHRMRPRPLCGIPDYPYRPTNITPNPTVTSTSLVRLSAAPVPGALPGSPIAAARSPVVFQLADPRLQLDHCFLSRVAVTLYEDGRYLVTFRADQNPQFVAARGDPALTPSRDIGSPLKPGERVETILQTTQLRRNWFSLSVRGYALAPLRQELPGLGVGKPALFDLPIAPFMVERGEPYYGRVEGRSEAVRRSFELIDRVEVDFTYR